jgi:hypothetical protein
MSSSNCVNRCDPWITRRKKILAFLIEAIYGLAIVDDAREVLDGAQGSRVKSCEL